MTDWRHLEPQICQRARLTHRLVAVASLDATPHGVVKFTGTEPSGCRFWRLVAAGRTLYTVPSDHFNCAVGSYTLHMDLSPERASETEQTLGKMFRVGYIRPEEVPAIPRLIRQVDSASSRTCRLTSARQRHRLVVAAHHGGEDEVPRRLGGVF